MSEAWIEGCPVQRIMFRDGLVISLGDYNEVVIAVPMWLTLPPSGKVATGDRLRRSEGDSG